MKLFRNPVFVIILSAVLIISSTVISTRAKLGGRVDDVVEIFYNDSGADPSIASLLREIDTRAATLAAVAADYGVDAEDFSYQVDWLDMALRYNRGDEDYIYSEYSALVKSLQSLRRQLGNASLSEQDRALVDETFSQIDADEAQITALASEYNGFVRSFNRRYGNPLARALAAFAGVEMPREFN